MRVATQSLAVSLALCLLLAAAPRHARGRKPFGSARWTWAR